MDFNFDSLLTVNLQLLPDRSLPLTESNNSCSHSCKDVGQPRYRSSHSSRKLTLLPYCCQLPLASQIGVEPCESPPIAEYWAGLSCVGLVSAATVVESPWAQLPVMSRRHGSQQSSALICRTPWALWEMWWRCPIGDEHSTVTYLCALVIWGSMCCSLVNAKRSFSAERWRWY